MADQGQEEQLPESHKKENKEDRTPWILVPWREEKVIKKGLVHGGRRNLLGMEDHKKIDDVTMAQRSDHRQ